MQPSDQQYDSQADYDLDLADFQANYQPDELPLHSWDY